MDKNLKNIVLIGMPGCGKTTIGKILSKKSGVKLVDLDKYIEASSGRKIPDIFAEGEGVFRSLEERAVSEFSKERGIIISTGGGIVKNYSNIKALKENGIIIFIDRPIENIAVNVNLRKRPLLKDGIEKLYTLYNERYELYKKYSDFQIINNGSLEEAVEKVIKITHLQTKAY